MKWNLWRITNLWIKTPERIQIQSIRLSNTRSNGSKEVIRSHINFTISIILDTFQRCEITKNFVRCGISPDSIFVRNELHNRGVGCSFNIYNKQGIEKLIVWL